MMMMIVQILCPVLPAFCSVAYETLDDVQITLYAVFPTLYSVNITICNVLFKVYDVCSSSYGVLIIIMMMMMMIV